MKKYNCDLIIPFELNKTYIYEITKVKNNEECRNNLVHKQLLDYSIYADQVNKYRGDLSITKYLFFFFCSICFIPFIQQWLVRHCITSVLNKLKLATQYIFNRVTTWTQII